MCQNIDVMISSILFPFNKIEPCMEFSMIPQVKHFCISQGYDEHLLKQLVKKNTFSFKLLI